MPFNLLNGPSGPTFGAPNSAGGSAPVITSPAFLVAGTVGTLYPTTTFTATGTAPITWSIQSGTLPTGMGFSSGGVLSGTPTVASSGTIAFKATNAFGLDERPLSLTVNAAGASPNYVIALDDWSTGSAVPIGTLTLNVNNGIITPQDSTLAAHYSGGIQTWRSASSIIHGPAGEQFEFGAMMFTVTNGAFDSTDLYQVLVGCKPYGRWASYPFSDTFNKATDITHPAPFKIRILNGSGALVTTLQMRDGLPINSPSLSQSRSPYTVFDANFGNEAAAGYADSPPLRPFFNCAMMLPWQNKRPKPLPSARVKIPQNNLSTYRPSQAKVAFTTNAMPPIVFLGGSNSQLNSTNHWHAAPKWPMGPVNPAWSRGNDPYIDVNAYAGGAQKRAWTISGWGYEPGSISTHDWITGPGGTRFDRWQLPTPAAYYLADPSWVRPLDTDGSTIVDHVQNFGFAYFNHSCHYLQNVKTFETISNTKTTFYNNVYGESWYGGSSTPAANMVNAVATRFQTSSYYYDKNGNRFWNNWVLDDQHSHQQPGLWSYAFGSPMHMVSTKHLTTAAQMATLGGTPSAFWAVNPTSATAGEMGFPGYVMNRVMAYRMAKFLWMWLNSNSDTNNTRAFGLPRSEVISMLKDEFAAARLFYQNFDDYAATSPLHSTSKNLGGPFGWQSVPTVYRDAGASSYYFYVNGGIAVPGYTGPNNVGYGKLVTNGTNTVTILSKYTMPPGRPFQLFNSTLVDISPATTDGWYMVETENPGVSFTFRVASAIAANESTTEGVYVGKVSAGDFSPYLVSTTAGAAFTYSGATITCTTTNNHNLAVGERIAVKGTTATTNPPNGVWKVATIVSPTQFTFTAYSTPTGTITAAAGEQKTLYGKNYVGFLMQQGHCLYLAQVVTIMKTSGMWDELRSNADATLAADATFVLDWWVKVMTRYSANAAVDGGLYLEITVNELDYVNYRSYVGGIVAPITRPKNTSVFTMADTPQNYTDVKNNIVKEGTEDWFKKPSGAYQERGGSYWYLQHQWVHALRNHWDATYINSLEAGLTTKLDSAITLYETAINDWKVNRIDVLPPVTGPTDTTNGYAHMLNDFFFAILPGHVYRTPAQVAAGNNSW
jgi:hypothetical protein